VEHQLVIFEGNTNLYYYRMALRSGREFHRDGLPLSAHDFGRWASSRIGCQQIVVKDKAYLKIPKQMNIRHLIIGEVRPAKVGNLSSTLY
jgi:hypothetical protein